MYTKTEFLSSLKRESKIIKHLALGLSAAQLAYRPTPGQRSTLELLQYLTSCARSSADYLVSGNWDHYEAQAAAAGQVTAVTFAKAMDKQIAQITKLLAPLGDAAIKRKTIKHWNNSKLSFSEGLIEIVLKPLTAYRMQLFLYAKASGSTALGSSDCWFGVTKKEKKAAAAQA